MGIYEKKLDELFIRPIICSNRNRAGHTTLNPMR